MSKTRAVPDGDTHDMKEALDTLEALESASKPATPWWVIALKTLAYLIGLLLAGYGTSAAAQTLLNFYPLDCGWEGGVILWGLGNDRFGCHVDRGYGN